jgi:hypothetical protein
VLLVLFVNDCRARPLIAARFVGLIFLCMSISPSEKWAHGALDALDGAPNAREANVHLVIRRAGLAALIEPTAVGDASLLRHFVASVSRQNSVRFQRTGKKGDAATNARALAVYKADVQACPALLGHALLGPFERQFTTVHMPFTTRMHDILGSLVKVRACPPKGGTLSYCFFVVECARAVHGAALHARHCRLCDRSRD